MAVSDFTPAFSFQKNSWQKTYPLLQRKKNWTIGLRKMNRQIPLFQRSLLTPSILSFVLKKTPKIISYLREWQPKAKIIGFKLLVDVPKESLLAVAKNSLINNKTDFIFANDLTEIHGETHHGYLLSKDGTVEEAQSKSEIAALITEKIRLEESK